MKRCGLLGKKLGHSYSPAIHAMLGDYSYELFEKPEEELPDFLRNGQWDGLNVTIPYKKTVVPYCSELSETAARTGSVNTLVKREDGSIYGDNTDAPGFYDLVRNSGIAVGQKKVLVLGSGGASAAVCAALQRLNARIVVISRSGPDNYENIGRHADASVIVNTTPVGMYPDNLSVPLDPGIFPNLTGVIDVVYNPARTGILLRAEELGIPCVNGLYMLVAQARRSAEQFIRKKIDDSVVSRITGQLSASMKNIVLIGMPGCGKTAIAKELGIMTGRPVFDSDGRIEEDSKKTIPEIFDGRGEEYFRELESKALAALGKASGTVIATGGGCVTKERNYPLLHQNGTIVWIRRDLEKLPREGRPLSRGDLSAMYRIRKPLYEKFADIVIDSKTTPEEAAEIIRKQTEQF